MKYLVLTLVFSAMLKVGWSVYPYNYYGQQHVPQELILQQIQTLQQQIYFLKQQQAQFPKATNVDIILPKGIIDEFEYIPTVQGYKISYKLPDGTTREENAFATGLRMDEYSLLDSKNTDFTAVGAGGRPKMMIKNRKLSPGSLKGLAG